MSTTPGPALTPDDVRALLEADVANIVALVNAGQPLTKAQRERLEECRRQPARPAVAPAPSPEAPPAFALEVAPAPEPAAPAPAAPAVTPRTQADFANLYGYGVRTIKLWSAEGRAVGKPPPLDDPAAMLVWWHEVKKNTVPARLLAAAETAKAARVAVAAPISPAPAVAHPGTSEPPPPAVPLAVGFVATLDRVRHAEAQASKRWLDEFNKVGDDRDDAKATRLRKDWSELSEQLRFLEKAAPEVLKSSGEMLLRDDVRRILRTIHGPIVSGVRSLFRRVRNKARAGASLDDLEKLYSAEVEALFGELLASEFAPAA